MNKAIKYGLTVILIGKCKTDSSVPTAAGTPGTIGNIIIVRPCRARYGTERKRRPDEMIGLGRVAVGGPVLFTPIFRLFYYHYYRFQSLRQPAVITITPSSSIYPTSSPVMTILISAPFRWNPIVITGGLDPVVPVCLRYLADHEGLGHRTLKVSCL